MQDGSLLPVLRWKEENTAVTRRRFRHRMIRLSRDYAASSSLFLSVGPRARGEIIVERERSPGTHPRSPPFNGIASFSFLSLLYALHDVTRNFKQKRDILQIHIHIYNLYLVPNVSTI